MMDGGRERAKSRDPSDIKIIQQKTDMKSVILRAIFSEMMIFGWFLSQSLEPVGPLKMFGP